jgi:outer membrane translocation and assembly module TamA
MRELLDDRNLPVDTMNWLYKIAQQFKGDVAPVKRDGTSNDPGITPTEARERIPQIIKDLVGLRETDPRYRDLQKKLVEYQKLANASQAA